MNEFQERKKKVHLVAIINVFDQSVQILFKLQGGISITLIFNAK